MDVTTALGLFALALTVGVYGSIIGAGGGFVMVAGLVLIFDLEGIEAAGTSILTTLFIQLTGAYTYTRKGLVERPVALWFALGSVPVALLSAVFIADRIPADTFELIVGVLLLALAVFVIIVPSVPADSTGRDDPRRGALAGSGSVIGVLSGGFGVGAGLVTVPTIGRLQRLPAHRAAATTTLIGAMSGTAAGLGHTIAATPRWSFLPFVIAGAVIGARVGASNAGRLSQRTVIALLAGGLVAAGLPLLLAAL